MRRMGAEDGLSEARENADDEVGGGGGGGRRSFFLFCFKISSNMMNTNCVCTAIWLLLVV